MQMFASLTRSVAAVALIAAAASPALAEGKADRARSAIAAAQGKVDALNKLGTGGETPRLSADAQAALARAKEDLSAGRKEEAIETAINAGQLADRAMGEAQQRRTAAADASQAAQADAALSASASAAQAADANARADAAQQQAADANARADAAQQQAAAAQAAADTARQAPAPATTVVVEKTTQRTAATPVKRVVKRPAHVATRAATTEKTTTTVTTTPQ